MTDIDKTLNAFNYFHDWHVDSITLRSEANSPSPGALALSLRLLERRAEAIFHGMTCLGVQNGGIVNIVLSMERARPNTEVEAVARALLGRSMRGRRAAEHIVYLEPTAGFEIAVEFDSLEIIEHNELQRNGT